MRILRLIFLIFSVSASASEQFRILMDDEVESAIEGWLAPLYRVAGIKKLPKIILIDSSEMNAAALPSGEILVFSGLLMRLRRTEELLAVLAHETAHIAAAHSLRSDDFIKSSGVPAVVALLVGGAASILSGQPELLVAGIAGGLHTFERKMLGYSKQQEENADRAAIRYLVDLSWPADGLCSFFKRIKEEGGDVDNVYASTHPLTKDRLKKAESLIKYSASSRLPLAFKQQFERIQAKLRGFLRPSRPHFFGKQSPSSEIGLYENALRAYQQKEYKEALKFANQLLQKKPRDAFYYELKGQILFDLGNSKDSVSAFEKAIENRPLSASLHILLAQAVLDAASPSSFKFQKASASLKQALQKEPRNVYAWRLLSKAHGLQGDFVCAKACLAEEAWILGDKDGARKKGEAGKACKDPFVKKRNQDLLYLLGKPSKKIYS